MGTYEIYFCKTINKFFFIYIGLLKDEILMYIWVYS